MWKQLSVSTSAVYTQKIMVQSRMSDVWETVALFNGATPGVTVSMSAFLACHQCYCASLSLAWGLNLRALVCGIFWSLSPGFSLGTLVSSPPSSVNGSANKIKNSNKCRHENFPRIRGIPGFLFQIYRFWDQFLCYAHRIECLRHSLHIFLQK